jgi:hypothetical protein
MYHSRMVGKKVVEACVHLSSLVLFFQYSQITVDYRASDRRMS